MTPDISIIIPVYNAASYLHTSVTSLLRQTHKNIEICLVDDGSNDGSGELCDQFAADDDRVRVIHKENAGQGLARNDGLTIATGMYVAFLDADDYWETDACERIWNRICETDADLCSFGYCKEKEDGTIIARPIVRETTYKNDEIRTTFLPHYFGDDPTDDNLRGVSACMSCFRRYIVKEHNICFASERKVLSEDTIFNLEFCKYCRIVATIESTILHYVMHAGSHTHRVTMNRLDQTIAFCDILQEYAADYGLADNVSIARRLQGTMWITIMEVIRHAATCKNGTMQIQELLQRADVQENASYMVRQPLNIKQRLLAHAICSQWAIAVYWMGRVHL